MVQEKGAVRWVGLMVLEERVVSDSVNESGRLDLLFAAEELEANFLVTSAYLSPDVVH